jgi:hypothetical protein
MDEFASAKLNGVWSQATTPIRLVPVRDLAAIAWLQQVSSLFVEIIGGQVRWVAQPQRNKEPHLSRLEWVSVVEWLRDCRQAAKQLSACAESSTLRQSQGGNCAGFASIAMCS